MAIASWDVAGFVQYDDRHVASLDPDFLAGKINTNNQSVTDMEAPQKEDYLQMPDGSEASFHGLWVATTPGRSLLELEPTGTSTLRSVIVTTFLWLRTVRYWCASAKSLTLMLGSSGPAS